MRGVNVHLYADSTLDAVVQMHLNWIRMDFNWSDIQPLQSTWSWTDTDNQVEAAMSRGLNILGNLTTTPPWACRLGDSGVACVPRSGAEWQAFVAAVATRYRGAVKAWGLWNEPDGERFWNGSANDWATIILVPGAAAIRAADPVAVVSAPDLSGSTRPRIPPRDLFTAMRNVNAKELIDVVSLHAYPEGPCPGPNGILGKVFTGCGVDSLMLSVDLYGDLGSKPVWITEFGFDDGGASGGGGTGGDIEATFELFGPRTRVTGMFDYMLVDSGNDHHGLLDEGGSWKAGAFVLKNKPLPHGYDPDPPLLEDHFDSPWSGLLHRWSPWVGSGSILNGGLTSLDVGFAARGATAMMTDQSIEATGRITNTFGDSTRWIGLRARAPASGDFQQGGYLALLRANGEAVLWKPGGNLAAAPTYLDPVNTYVRMKLRCIGTTISFDVNGVTVISVQDGTYSSGFAGVQLWAVGIFDNVLIQTSEQQQSAPAPLGLYTLPPCRLVDTREASGGFVPVAAGPPVRRFSAWDRCGIPNNAVTIVGNVTATGATATGAFHVFPAGYGVPPAIIMSTPPGTSRAGSGMVTVNAPRSAPGAFDVFFDGPSNTSSHFILDVTGYFAPRTGQ